MRRRRKPEEPENHDRWVVSYADFITLLFAFFTTMYALSHVDLGKVQRFEGSMKTAFKTAGPDAVNTPLIEGIKPANYADVGLEKSIRAELNRLVLAEGVVVQRNQRGVTLSLGEELLFQSGDAELNKDARPLLSAVASIIKSSQRAILIEGHTDNIPLRGSRYTSNLELSAARASQTYACLLNEEGLSPERMSASGYGEYRPRESNATPDGRARNRRVEIVFVSEKQGS